MKKLLISLSLLLTTTANAGGIATGDVRFPFLANGGFKGACDRLEWIWGYDTKLLGGLGSYACYNKRYIAINRITRDRFIIAK